MSSFKLLKNQVSLSGTLMSLTLYSVPAARVWAKVRSMHLGLNISGVELTFLSAWIWLKLYSLAYRHNKSRRTAVLIFVPQVYADLQRWRTPEELLAYHLREFFTE